MPVAFQPDRENTRLLRDAFGRFATGVTVVTTQGADGPVGITANSFSSVSLDPPLVLWAPSKTSRRYPYFAEADHYAIHVLGADQADLCMGFAKNAFALQHIEHERNIEGVPVLANCLARFECKRVAGYDGGDHMIILGEVLRAEMRDGDALAFFAGKYGEFAQT
ncbi:flavin reductase family protein [Cognatishimia sp. SS12]|nr:flavin reductase family protein [Cognatishimia sp. SS12]